MQRDLDFSDGGTLVDRGIGPRGERRLQRVDTGGRGRTMFMIREDAAIGAAVAVRARAGAATAARGQSRSIPIQGPAQPF